MNILLNILSFGLIYFIKTLYRMNVHIEASREFKESMKYTIETMKYKIEHIEKKVDKIEKKQKEDEDK